MKFFIKKKTLDLVTFTEEILNRKFHFLCSEITCMNQLELKKVKLQINWILEIFLLFLEGTCKLAWRCFCLQRPSVCIDQIGSVTVMFYVNLRVVQVLYSFVVNSTRKFYCYLSHFTAE